MRLPRRLDFNAGFRREDRDLTALLVILGITIFIVTPLVTGAQLGSDVMLVMFVLLTIVGVGAVSDHPAGIWMTTALAVASVGLAWAARHDPTVGLLILDLAGRLVFTLLLGVVVTFRVFRAGNVSHHRIQGAVVVFLLSGLVWGYLFEIIAVLDSEAFQVAGSHSEPVVRMGVFRYFSFVTLTTLGYGDILPVSPIARALTTLEALFGQLYPAVVVARLVTLELAHHSSEISAWDRKGPDA